MAGPLPIHRKLFIHPAHRTVGVSGAGLGRKPYCWQETWSSYSICSTSSEPKRVALVFRRQDVNDDERLALIERILMERGNARCDRIEFESSEADLPRQAFAESDVVLWLGQGLQIARHWSDLQAEYPAKGDQRSSLNFVDAKTGIVPFPAEVENFASFRGHPVLDGVGSFTARLGISQSDIPEDAIRLMMGRMDGEYFPTAWSRYGRRGRVFGTLLGSIEDFRRPNFVRLVLNALDWVSG